MIDVRGKIWPGRRSLRPIMRQLVVMVFLLGCATGRAPRPASPGVASTAFVDVTVVSSVEAASAAHQTVIVENDRITRVGPTAEVAPPAHATIIHASGQYLIPGMADMHVHLPDTSAELERVLDLSLAAGVTVIRGMQGAPSHLAARAQLAADHRPAPELVLAGPPITTALSPEAARSLVDDQKQAGYDLIKILGGIELPAYQALVAEAAAQHIWVVGHVPAAIGIDAALAAHQRSIEHVQGYFAAAKAGDAELATLVTRTRDAGVWNCPTLDFYAVALGRDRDALPARDGIASYATDAELAEWQQSLGDHPPPEDGDDRIALTQRIARALAAGGAPLLVGSDTPDTYALPGFGYVEELRRWIRAGLSPAIALRAATRNAAAFLDRPHDGVIAIGARADLVLLDRDPLASIDNVAHPAGVMVRGTWLPRVALDRLLAAHRAR